jgi:thiol-disulfide isomerase/thioredoxin
MKSRCSILLVAVAFMLLAACKSPNPSKLQPGDAAPALAAAEWVQGGPVDVTDGQSVYVVEFFASWCPWCRMQDKRLSRLQSDYADRGVKFVAITNESADDLKDYLAADGKDFELPVATDDNNITFALYGPQKIPRVFVIDRDGIIAFEGHPSSPGFIITLNKLASE